MSVLQIIESTDCGVRSVVLRLEAGEADPAFVLFPMIHVAEPSFYEEIGRRLEDCDLVLCEGVRSPTSSLLTLSYRFFAENPRLGLVSQNSMKMSHLADRTVHADVQGEAFESRWWRSGTWLRFVVPLFAPLFGLYLRYFGTRRTIAWGLGMNLRKSRADNLRDGDDGKIRALLLDWRNRCLIRVIDQQRRKHRDGEVSIAVLYGAGHMRAVLRNLLDECGYRVAKAEWTTVFEL